LHIERPSIINSSSDQELSIVSGDEEVMLTCEVAGDDIIGGYWERREGDSLSPENNMSSLSNDKTTLQLRIIKARPMHTGSYHCVVYSQWGMAQSRNIVVTITSKSDSIL